jgi:hypothetical protein
MVLRPHIGAWTAIIGLWIAAATLLGIGLLLAVDSYLTAAAVFIGLGLPLAVIPPAYFFRARVALENGIVVKIGTLRKVGWCAPEAVASIVPYTTRWAGSRWSADDFGQLESHGYAFRLADGTPIFKLSSTWWSEEGIWQLGTRLGLEGTLGGTSTSGMTRQHRAVPTVKPPKEALTGPPTTGTARLQARTVVVVLSVLLVIALVLLWPTISGKSYP